MMRSLVGGPLLLPVGARLAYRPREAPTRPAYEEKKATLQDEIELVQKELSKIDNLEDETRGVEDLRRTLMSMENPLSGHYVLGRLPEDLRVLPDHNISYGSREMAAKRRQEFYRRVGMRVKVGEELEITLGVNGISVSADERASASSSGSTSY